MNCQTCAPCEIPVPECIETLYLQTSRFDEVLHVEFKNQFGNVFRIDQQSEPSGILVIDLTDDNIMPIGLISSYAPVTITVYDKQDEVVPFDFPNDETYNCIIVRGRRQVPQLSNYFINTGENKYEPYY